MNDDRTIPKTNAFPLKMDYKNRLLKTIAIKRLIDTQFNKWSVMARQRKKLLLLFEGISLLIQNTKYLPLSIAKKSMKMR